MNKKEKQTKEQAILLAAEQEFMTKGYDGARTTSIAEAAGVTHAMLHYYFRTKEQLFERILNEKMALMASSFMAVLGDPNLPLLKRIEQGIVNHFDCLMANPELPRFIINEVIAHPARQKIMRENILHLTGPLFAQLQNDLDSAAKRGEVERMDVRMLMLDLLSLNVLPFLAYPVIETIFSDLTGDRQAFFEARKAESVETIMRRLKKQKTI
ncbi:MAG: TetR/AcrR family transcriptional regulator [Bacteroidales bacterium]|nr:TetR/AcrR family transcriptional regulator [Bacteroidales bacterium]